MFEPGHVYRRRDLHDRVGGQRQGGISTPVTETVILLFTGESGEQYGYHDGWEIDGTFRYFGEGQVGDMRFVSGNKAIRDHAANGKDLHLFEILPKRQGVRYRGQMVCAGFEIVPDVPDLHGQPRNAIAFRLAPLEATLVDDAYGADPRESRDPVAQHELADLWTLPLEEVARRAETLPQGAATAIQALRTTYRRSAAVRVYVLRRANGVCEGCGEAAPFVTTQGHPYLEPHHTRRLSDGGPDDPHHVIALCPTCHRRAHYAQDATSFNAHLIARLRSLMSTTS